MAAKRRPCHCRGPETAVSAHSGQPHRKFLERETGLDVEEMGETYSVDVRTRHVHIFVVAKACLF